MWAQLIPLTLTTSPHFCCINLSTLQQLILMFILRSICLTPELAAEVSSEIEFEIEIEKVQQRV